MSKINDSYLRDVKHNGDYRVSNSGDLLEIDGPDNVKQRAYHMIITEKGTIVHRPTFGIGIKSYVNKLGNLSTQQDLALKIKSGLETDKDIANVSRVQVQDNGEGKFVLLVTFEILAYGTTTLEVEI